MGLSDASKIRTLSDPLHQYKWEVFFPLVPGAANPVPLTYYARSVTIPGRNVETVESWYQGIGVKHAGKTTYPGGAAINFEENQSMTIVNTILAWQNWMNDVDTGKRTGGYKVDITINQLKNDNSIAGTYVLYNAYPESYADRTLAESSDLVQLEVTFQYDYWKLISR